MQNVDVHELRERLSQYLDMARTGQAVAITEHGKVIAWLMPGENDQFSRIEALMTAGLITWQGNRLSPLEPVAPLRGEVTVAALVSEMR